MKEQQTLKDKFGVGFNPADPTAEQQKALDLSKQEAAATVKKTEATTPFEEFPDEFVNDPTVRNEVTIALKDILK